MYGRLLRMFNYLYYLDDNKVNCISLLQKYCEFFSLTEDKESVKYILPEGMTVFSILNIPPKYNKEEVKNHIELMLELKQKVIFK